MKTILFAIVCSIAIFSPHLLQSKHIEARSVNQIVLTPEQLPDFREVYIHTVSDVQFYDVYITNLTTAMNVVAEYPLMISLDCYSDFAQELTLVPASGVIDQRVFVRAHPGSSGEFHPVITHTTTSAGSAELATQVTGIPPQIPQGYYITATSVGHELKTQLHNIIKGHNTLGYNSLWTHFRQTDVTFSGFVWDIYSDIPCSEPPYLFVFGEDQDTGSGGNIEGDVYNREHSMPRSWFGGDVNPMNSDMYHIYPVDKHVNAVRNNYPFGMVASPTWTSLNGGKLGANTAGDHYTGTAFEPIDEYKGDLARAFLYMITRYEDRIEDWTYSEEGNTMFDHNTFPGYEPWAIEMLMEWHRNDPVSQRERLRNDLIYELQGNRNPFVDYPVFAEKIWGDTTVFVNNPDYPIDVTIYPNPAGESFVFSSPEIIERLEIFSTAGKQMLIHLPAKASETIDISALDTGVYIVRFFSSSVSGSQLLMVR